MDQRGQVAGANVLVVAVLSVVIGAIFLAVGQNIINVMGITDANVNTAFTILGVLLIVIPLAVLAAVARNFQ